MEQQRPSFLEGLLVRGGRWLASSVCATTTSTSASLTHVFPLAGNHIVLAILEEQDGHTQHAIFKYGRALDTIDWVNQSLGPAPDRILYGRGDAKERIEAVYEPVFGRGVQ
jgi:hypothetical protein